MPEQLIKNEEVALRLMPVLEATSAANWAKTLF
jgi:hypothetical protein